MRNFIIFLVVFALSSSAALNDYKLDRFMQEKQFQKALEYIDKKYPQEERSLDIWLKMGEINEFLGLKEKAIGCYVTVLKIHPSNLDALKSIIDIYNSLEFYSNAYVMAKKALTIDSTNVEIRYECAKACLKLEKFKEAQNILEGIYQINNNAKKELALIYYKQQLFDKAIPLLKQSFNSRQELEVAQKISSYYLEKDQDTLAIQYLEFENKMNSKDTKICLELARAYFHCQLYIKSSFFYAQANEANFKSEDFYNVGFCRKEEKKDDDAIQFFSTYLDKERNSNLVIDANWSIADLFLKQKDYQQASVHLKVIEARDSKYPTLNLLLAKCYDKTKNYKNAEIQANKYLVKDTSDVEAKLILANAYENLGFKTKSKQIRDEVLTENSNDPIINQKIGEYYYQNDDFEKALKFFERIYVSNQNGEVLEKIAVCAFSINEDDKASDAAESVLKYNKNSIVSREILYEIHMKYKHFRQARIYLEELIQLKPNLEYYQDLLTCYEELNLREDILKIDQQIVSLDPNDEKSRRRLAETYIEQTKFDEAQKIYDYLIKIKKIKVDDYPKLIKTSIELKQKSRTIEYLTSYKQLKPNEPTIYKQLADLYFETNDLNNAILYYNKTLEYKPYIQSTYRNLAKVVIAKKLDSKTIILIAEKAIENKEYDHEIYSYIGNYYFDQSSYSKALENYQEAQKIKNDIKIFSNLAACQVKLKKNSDAIVSYEQLAAFDTTQENFKILGNLYQEQGKDEEAIKNFKKYLKNNKDDKLATTVAMFEYQKQNYKEAILYFKKIEIFSNQTLFAFGESCFKTDDWDKTIEILQNFLKKYLGTPKTAITYKYLGCAFENKKQFKESISAYRNYLQYEDNADIYYLIGTLEYKIDSSNAKKTFLENSKKYPEDYRNFVELGKINKNDIQTSKKMFERAVELNDTLLFVWTELGSIYNNLKDTENQIIAYKKVIMLDPQNFEANKYLGISLFAKGQDKEALLYLELARSKKLSDPEIMFTLAQIYDSSDKQTEASLLLQSAKKLKPDDPEICYYIVNYNLKKGKLEESLEELEHLIKIKGTKQYFNLYINILFELKKFKQAEKVIETERKKDPENLEYLMLLAQAQKNDKRLDDALETYKMILYVNSSYIPALLNRAQLHLDKLEYERSLDYFEKVLKTDAKNITAMLGMAKVYKLQGDITHFSESVEKVKTIDPQNEEVLKLK